MRWKPSKLGVVVTLFGAFFAACEVYGTYGYFMDQQGGLDYVVLLGCGVAASVPFLPPFADAARRRGWPGLSWSMWLALPLALVVVMGAALQRTGSATDQEESDRTKARAALALAKQNKADAEAEIRKLGTVRALADLETDLAKAKLHPRYSSSAQCTDATAKPSRELCAEVVMLEGERTKAVELAKHRKIVSDSRVKLAAGSGDRDSLAYRISGYTGNAISEEQVRLWQPLFIPILASWLAGAFLTFGMRMDLHFDDDDTHRAPGKAPKSETTDVTPLKAIIMEQEPEPVRVPARPRPRLAATTRKPIGAVLDFLHEGVEIVDSSARIEMADCYIGYVAWCKAKSLQALGPGEFCLEMTDLCAQCGVPVHGEAGCVYLVNVRLGSHVTALEEGA